MRTVESAAPWEHMILAGQRREREKGIVKKRQRPGKAAFDKV